SGFQAKDSAITCKFLAQLRGQRPRQQTNRKRWPAAGSAARWKRCSRRGSEDAQNLDFSCSLPRNRCYCRADCTGELVRIASSQPIASKCLSKNGTKRTQHRWAVVNLGSRRAAMVPSAAIYERGNLFEGNARRIVMSFLFAVPEFVQSAASDLEDL